MNTAPDYVFPALDSGYHWDKDIVTFSIPIMNSTWDYENDPDPSYNHNYSSLSNGQANQFRKAIQSWNELITLEIVEVYEPNDIGDIRVAFSDKNSAAGWARVPHDNNSAGDIWINSSYSDESFQDLLGLINHELGHALGLQHTFSNIDSKTNRQIFFSTEKYNHHLPESEDNSLYTLMSYRQAYKAINLNYSEQDDDSLVLYMRPETSGLFDILTIQSIYGANYTTRAENDVYYFTEDPVYTPFYRTIWDGAGIDTIDASEQKSSSLINLQDGSFSSIGYVSSEEFKKIAYDTLPQYKSWLDIFFPKNQDNLYTGENNLAIAFGAVIENAIGGKNNDTLLGNEVDNELTGNAGDDFLNGKDGFDTAIFNGDFSQYKIQFSNDKKQLYITDQIGNDGTDTLENIEQLQFTNKVVSVAELKNSSTQVPMYSNEVITQPLEGDSNHINYFLIESSTVLSSPISFHFQTQDGSAVAGEDYIATSGTVIMEAGTNSVAIGVEIIADNQKENNESFSLQVTANTVSGDAITLLATHTILDDDIEAQNQRQVIKTNDDESNTNIQLTGFYQFDIDDLVI